MVGALSRLLPSLVPEKNRLTAFEQVRFDDAVPAKVIPIFKTALDLR